MASLSGEECSMMEMQITAVLHVCISLYLNGQVLLSSSVVH